MQEHVQKLTITQFLDLTGQYLRKMNPTKESVNNPSVDYDLAKYNTLEFFYSNFPALQEIVDALDTKI